MEICKQVFQIWGKCGKYNLEEVEKGLELSSKLQQLLKIAN